MAVTVADVARAAGVSVSTVSYAMSGTRKISEETRRRILQAMDDLGYTPNALARGLRGGRSHVLALLFPLHEDVLDISGVDYVIGASDHAQSLGYHLLLWTSEGEGLPQLRKLATRGLIDGALLMQVTMDDARPDVLVGAGLPFTLLGRNADPSGIDYVDTDGVAAGRTALEYLAGLGHRVLGFVDQPDSQRERGLGLAVRVFEGLETAAAALGVELVSVPSAHSFDGGYAAMKALMERKPDLTAVIAHNERAVGGLMTAAGDLGLRVPRDLSVVSIIMGAAAAESTNPPMTTVSEPGRDLGRMAADHLIRRVKGDVSPPLQDLFPGRLVERGSSGPVRRGRPLRRSRPG